MSGVYYAVMPCGVTRLVVGSYRLLWCSKCRHLVDVAACEIRPL